MCPHRSNFPKNREKRKKNFEKSTNKITLREMQKTQIQSFFLNGFSLYMGSVFWARKTPYFVSADPYWLLNTEKTYLVLNTENTYFFRK